MKRRYLVAREPVSASAWWGITLSSLVLICFAVTGPFPRTVTALLPVLKENFELALSAIPVLGSRNFVLARSIAPIADLPIATSVATATQTVELRVHSGDTLIALLSSVGATLADAHAAARALEPVFHPREIRPGWKLQVTLNPQESPGQVALQSVAFRPSVERDVEVFRTSVDGDARFMAHTLDRNLHRESKLSSGTIEDSLFNAGADAGVPHDLLLATIRTLSFDVDFQRDIRAGDQFELFYDTFRDDDGVVAKSGEVNFAKLILSGKELRYYRFTPSSGVTDLFSAEGKSIRKALLQTPVDATRISSNFGMRRHPILGYSTLHRGVDFAAAAGTPIQAAGNGTIVSAGPLGSYGNYVRIRHDANYSTAYAHLKKFAGGIRKNVRVRQGDIIGYVGATGRATGPHLHYEVLRDNRQVNPRGLRLPSGEALAGDDLKRFKAHQLEIDDQRTGHQPPSLLASVARDDAGKTPLPM
jgi:murein DD-endopeptidase MepM/ murein hydrolase activator NlpD